MSLRARLHSKAWGDSKLAVGVIMDEHENSLPYWERKPLSEIAEEIGFPAEAVNLVADVGPFMERHCMHSGQTEVPHTDALGFCKNLWVLAIQTFGASKARLIMEEWGIHRAEDIGRIVFALVETGWLSASETDTESDFVGLGTVGELFGEGFGGDPRRLGQSS